MKNFFFLKKNYTMEQSTSNKPKGATKRKVPKFKFKKCNGCNGNRKDLNEFNECDSCEKCKRCNNQIRDYSNGFQICSSCCNQIEQVTPSGFKPNFKFEECKRCNGQRDFLNEFQVCNSCCSQMEQKTPSGFKPNFKFEI